MKLSKQIESRNTIFMHRNKINVKAIKRKLNFIMPHKTLFFLNKIFKPITMPIYFITTLYNIYNTDMPFTALYTKWCMFVNKYVNVYMSPAPVIF